MPIPGDLRSAEGATSENVFFRDFLDLCYLTSTQNLKGIFFRWEVQKFLNWQRNTFGKLLGFPGSIKVATVKIRNFRCEDGTIFRISTILALKKLFLLVAPSGGLKHQNMRTRKVSKFNLETFKLFTKKYVWNLIRKCFTQTHKSDLHAVALKINEN